MPGELTLILHSLFTHTTHHKEKDPINLFFFNNGRASIVEYRLRHSLQLEWRSPTLSHKQLAYVGDSSEGARADWKLRDVDLELPLGMPIIGTRRHLRLFEGYDPDPLYGYWCIGSIHLEHLGLGHVVDSWEEPRDFLGDLFMSRSLSEQSFIGDVYMKAESHAGVYQGRPFDGLILCVEILS